MPGAFTRGTSHFAHASGPADKSVTAEYRDLDHYITSYGEATEGLFAPRFAPSAPSFCAWSGRTSAGATGGFTESSPRWASRCHRPRYGRSSRKGLIRRPSGRPPPGPTSCARKPTPYWPAIPRDHHPERTAQVHPGCHRAHHQAHPGARHHRAPERRLSHPGDQEPGDGLPAVHELTPRAANVSLGQRGGASRSDPDAAHSGAVWPGIGHRMAWELVRRRIDTRQAGAATASTVPLAALSPCH
jgi:hypothetical protein